MWSEKHLEIIHDYKKQIQDDLNLNYFHSVLLFMGEYNQQPHILCSYTNNFNQNGEIISTLNNIYVKHPNEPLFKCDAGGFYQNIQDMENNMYHITDISSKELDNHYKHYNQCINTIQTYDNLIQMEFSPQLVAKANFLNLTRLGMRDFYFKYNQT